MAFLGRNKKVFGYAIYFIFITGVFLFYGFPSEAVQAYIQSMAEERITGEDFTLETVSLSLPFGLKLHQAALSPQTGKEGLRLKADSLTIQPDPRSLIKGDRVYHFKGHLYGGMIKGSVHFAEGKNGPPYSLRLTLSDIDLKSERILKGLLDLDLEGRLEGAVHYEAGNNRLYDGTGDADLMLSEGKVDVTLPLFALETLEFDQLVIKGELKNRRLDLGRLEFRGSDLNASLSGSISLNRQFLKSRLNLRGEIEPRPEFFRKLAGRPSTLELLKKRLRNGKLSFTVSGALDKPQMRII